MCISVFGPFSLSSDEDQLKFEDFLSRLCVLLLLVLAPKSHKYDSEDIVYTCGWGSRGGKRAIRAILSVTSQ